jgi:hypothetical protein
LLYHHQQNRSVAVNLTMSSFIGLDFSRNLSYFGVRLELNYVTAECHAGLLQRLGSHTVIALANLVVVRGEQIPATFLTMIVTHTYSIVVAGFDHYDAANPRDFKDTVSKSERLHKPVCFAHVHAVVLGFIQY